MKSYLKPGMTFVDVGANIGSHTVCSARLVSHDGRVFALEADSETFALLQHNVKLKTVSRMRYSSTNAFPIKRSQLLSTFILGQRSQFAPSWRNFAKEAIGEHARQPSTWRDSGGFSQD